MTHQNCSLVLHKECFRIEFINPTVCQQTAMGWNFLCGGSAAQIFQRIVLLRMGLPVSQSQNAFHMNSLRTSLCCNNWWLRSISSTHYLTMDSGRKNFLRPTNVGMLANCFMFLVKKQCDMAFCQYFQCIFSAPSNFQN